MTTCATDSQSFMYLEVTIPEGLTIAQYRRSRPPRRHGLARLRRRPYTGPPGPADVQHALEEA